MQCTLFLFGMMAAVLALPNAEPAVTGLAALEARQNQAGGGAAGTLGPFQGTIGGAINGPTGFVQGCIGGGGPGAGTTACFPVATAPANTDTRTHQAAGNVAGTLGPLSGFADSDGFCFGAGEFRTCLQPTATA